MWGSSNGIRCSHWRSRTACSRAPDVFYCGPPGDTKRGRETRELSTQLPFKVREEENVGIATMCDDEDAGVGSNIKKDVVDAIGDGADAKRGSRRRRGGDGRVARYRAIHGAASIEWTISRTRGVCWTVAGEYRPGTRWHGQLTSLRSSNVGGYHRCG